MAVGVQLELTGATLDQYDALLKRMGFTPGGKGEPGGLSHWVTKTDDGVRVTDVWATSGRIRRNLGPGPPIVTFYEVHNYLTAD